MSELRLARALCTDEAMRIAPRATAVRVGIVMSSRRRERTRQFFSARRDDAGRAGAGGGGPAPLLPPWPLLLVLPSSPGSSTGSAPPAPNAEPGPGCSVSAVGRAGEMFLLRDRTAPRPLTWVP